MTTARIVDISYHPPRTIGIRYTIPGDTLVYGIELPIEKCDIKDRIHKAIMEDYAKKIQDPNNDYLRELTKDLKGTEFELERPEDPQSKKMDQEEFKKRLFSSMMEDITKILLDSAIMFGDCDCMNNK